MGSHDQEIDGEWTNHGIEEMDDLEEVAVEAADDEVPSEEVLLKPQIPDEATGIMEIPFAAYSTDNSPNDDDDQGDPSEGPEEPLSAVPDIAEEFIVEESMAEEFSAVEPMAEESMAEEDVDIAPQAPIQSEPARESKPIAVDLERTIDEAMHSPEREELWDRAEQLARQADRMDAVGAAYQKLAASELETSVALALLDRAVQFFDEWMNDLDGVATLLHRVLDYDPTARWAFDRISLKLTVEARWDELLALYDRVLTNTSDLPTRLALLDEAAAVAKDCAGNPERAIDYLQKVFEAQPSDTRTASALERLLKLQKRHEDLIGFWNQRLQVLTGQEALSTRQQIASCWLEDLQDPNGALEAVEPLLDDPRTASAAGSLLEMIVSSGATTPEIRARALKLLGESYDETERWHLVIDALETAIGHVSSDERAFIHQQIARRLIGHDALEQALDHLAALLVTERDVWTDKRVQLVLRGEFKEKVHGFYPVLDREQGYRLLHLAAETAARSEASRDRAIELYRLLIEDRPDDAKAISNLTRLYSGADRTKDLLELRRHELGLAEDLDRRISLRLQIASLLVTLGDATDAITTLRDGLEEKADHEPTIDALIVQYEEQKRFDDLAEMLKTQAAAVQALGRTELAVRLWLQAARVCKTQLLDLEEAVQCYQRVVDLQPNIEALDELASACLQHEQYATAVSWLQQRLAISPSGQRTPTVERLATAQLGAKQTSQALETLRSGLAEDPGSLALRDKLAELYRTAEAWSELVVVLTEGADGSDDEAVRKRYLLEASDVLLHGLRSAHEAVPVLEQLVKLQPEDRAVRFTLATALFQAERFEQARTLTTKLIDEYGRRRPPERANLHLLLAQILRAQDKPTEAIQQLEQGVAMDMGNLRLQHLLGQVYRQTGQLDKAERAYHALVLLLRRRAALQRGPLQEGDVGIAEVLFELHLVSKDLGAQERAVENLESAFDAAALDPSENERFETALRAFGSLELLLRSLQQRLAIVDTAVQRANVLAEIAEAQGKLGQSDLALASLIQAIEENPEATALYDKAQELAQRAGELDEYAAMLEKASDRALQDRDQQLACRLLMQLGNLEEQERKNLNRAAQLYARAQQTECALPMVWSARARVAALVGDTTTELEMLHLLIDLPSDEVSKERTDALYRLASLELANRDSMQSGVITLTTALQTEPRYAQASLALQQALALNPECEEAIIAFERVARAANDDRWLLEALERRLHVQAGTQPMLQEAVDVAQRIGDTEKLEAFLLRSIDLAKQDDGTLVPALWAMQALADLRESQGNLKDAMQWLQQAAEVASDDEARALSLRVAQIAADSLNELETAVLAYERLLRLDPGDPNVWQPLLAVVRRMGDREKLEATLRSIIDDVSDLALRSGLRIELASLVRDKDRRDEAIELLRTVLAEDAEHAHAAEELGDLLQDSGRADELVALLTQQLEVSRLRSDSLSGSQFARRLTDLVADSNREQALQVFRDTLAWIPDDGQLMRGLLALLDPDLDAQERAEVIEKLLNTEGADDPLSLALDLVDARARMQDEAGLERALESAYRLEPEEPRVLEQYRRLAEQLENEAQDLSDTEQAVKKLFRAASIHADRLDDPGTAGQLLAAAQNLQPSDLGIIEQLVQAMMQSDQLPVAIERTTEAIERWDGDEAGRAQLHRLRASIWELSGNHEAAADDVEYACRIEGQSSMPELLDALTKARDAAVERTDFDAERNATLRIITLLSEMGQPEEAREALNRWVSSAPEDLQALRMLIEIDRAAGRWQDVAANCEHLVNNDTGISLAEGALMHAEACDHLGNPELARASLERALQHDNSHEEVRLRLRTLYEQAGEYGPLSNLLLIDANLAQDDGTRFEFLREAGRMRLANFDQAASAIGPLSQALELQPNDLEVMLLLADAYISAGLIQEVVQLLQEGIDRQGRTSLP